MFSQAERKMERSGEEKWGGGLPWGATSSVGYQVPSSPVKEILPHTGFLQTGYYFSFFDFPSLSLCLKKKKKGLLLIIARRYKISFFNVIGSLFPNPMFLLSSFCQ